MGRPTSSATTWLLLVLGPLLAPLVSNAALARWGAFWALLLTLPQGSSHRADATLRQSSGADIVVMGSSVAVHGVSAPALGGMLGQKAVNVGQNGASLVSTAMLVPRIVAAGPRQVLLLVSPRELQPRDAPDWRRAYDPRVAVQIFGLWGMAARPRAHLQGLAGWASVLYRHTPGLRAALGAPLPDGATDHPEGQIAFMQRTRQELATLGLATGPDVTALHVIAQRLAEAGIQLVACPAPLHPALRDRNSEQAVYDVLARTSAVVIPPRRLGRFAPELFMDPFHLTPAGQRRLTSALGAQLNAL